MKKVHSKNSNAFTLIELMIVVAIIGILASVAIPSFLKYIKKSKTSEVYLNLRKIYEGELTYYQEEHTDQDGAVLAKQFVYAPPTPNEFPTQNKRPGNWNQDSWTALKFAPDSPVLYMYGVEIDQGMISVTPNFAAWAIGDIDGDGITSTFYRFALVNHTTGEVEGWGGIFSDEPTE